MVERELPPKKAIEARRHGIGEWFGYSFVRLTADQRRSFALESAKKRPTSECPFRASCLRFDPKAVPGKGTKCTRQGGVCSLREYRKTTIGDEVRVDATGSLRTTCPYRFLQDGTIFQWVGSVILGNPSALVVRAIEFLEVRHNGTPHANNVAYLDNVLVHPTRRPVHWCALEIQAAHFSGASMLREFKALKDDRSTLPFPADDRYPNCRKSALRRLMWQLQGSVPFLRHWGKKMSVVVDEHFFSSLGQMDNVADLLNCDITWFVMRYDGSHGEAILKPAFHRFTTLERALEALTCGHAVTLGRLEETIAGRLLRQNPAQLFISPIDQQVVGSPSRCWSP